MCEEGVQPDDITFACLLSACSHAGLVDEGMHCYASKITDYMISAKLEHYTCIINLGHPGQLQEAENIIKAMPCRPDVVAWMVLLRIHGTVDMGEHVAKWVLNWSLKMLQVMCCHQTSMLVLAIGISVRMLNSRGRKEV
ncbi:hypothetical protein BDL97_03G029200 [Sphagnum fallax]|jgi:hypothetical protein|nr:hypothetical protein BDL97_03G029200 [Sphagnum fallax]